MKRHPGESKNMFMHASDLVKYMPIEKNTSDMLGPLFDLTNLHTKLTSHMPSPSYNQINTPQMKRMVNSGKNTHSRSVSETKKKYVASEQKWKCGYCGDMLDEMPNYWTNPPFDAIYAQTDLVHLFSRKNANGGIAWLSALCVLNCLADKVHNIV